MSEKSHASDDQPSSIGRYEITGTLGFGAMGAVYKAFDPVIKRQLAIKTIRLDVPKQSPQYATFKERFYQEAQISGTLSHPNIVTLFDLGEEREVPFLAMEYVEGQTLSHLLEEGTRFEPERVLALVRQVASALDYAHSRGVIHRDIKPSNLIVQESGEVKVTDFGIAKLLDSNITQTGSLLGTPSYMSPEQAMGDTLDGRSDIFSLGVCAFEMLSGEQPFPGNNVTSILYRLVHVDPVEPATLEMNGVVPFRWREVFHKVLAKKPDGRYQKAIEFEQALERCLGASPDELGEETAALGSPSPEERTVTLQQTPRPDSLPEAEEPPPAHPVDADTLVLHADPGGEMPGPDEPETVRMDPSALASGEGAPPAAAAAPPAVPGEGEPGPTEVLESIGEPTATMPPRSASGDTPPAPPRRPLPASWLLGGAAALFVVAAALVVGLLWQRGAATGPPVEVVPSPIVETPVVPTSGTLRVVSEPEGARVTVDGEARGETPLELEEVPFGDHEVTLALKGYQDQSHDVSLSVDNPTAALQAELSRRRPTSGTASFVSEPPGATVFVNGKKVGTTPLDGVRLRAGQHDVSFSLDDYDRWSGTVEVVAGRRARVETELVPVQPEAPPTPEPVDTTRTYENKPGEVDRLARKRSGDSPSYPSDRAPRLKSGERVSVTLAFLVTETGAVEEIEVTGSAGKVIDDVVTSAVRTWKFDPATIRGTPVKVRVVFRQTFLGG